MAATSASSRLRRLRRRPHKAEDRSNARSLVNRPVGTFEYSNLNYITLGVVVEAVSGMPYGDYLRDHVFAPLGMTHSYASQELAKRDGLAQGHRYLFGLPVAWDEPYPTAIVPAGYQISTASDMARYVAALSNHGLYRGTDIVGNTGGDRDYGIYWGNRHRRRPGCTAGP